MCPIKLITAAWCLPIESAPLRNSGIAIENGAIIACDTIDNLLKRYPNADRRDFPAQVLLPGLVNAHLHIDFGNFRTPPRKLNPAGATASAQLHWLAESMKLRLDSDLQGMRQSIDTCLDHLPSYGVTTVGASTAYEGIMDLALASGLRGVIYHEFFGSGSNRGRAQDRFESSLALIDKYTNRPCRFRTGFAPLAPYLLSRHLLQVVSQHAASANIPLQIHAAESFDEMEFFFNSSGPIGTNIFPLLGWGDASGQPLPPPFKQTPVAYLEQIGFLNAHPTIIGATQITIKDIECLRQHKCSVVYTPLAVKHFELGEFPLGKLLESGVQVSLGSESRLLPVDGNLWEEMRCVLKQGMVDGSSILQMATLGGASALGIADEIGSFREGKRADYLLVDLPAYQTTNDLESALIEQITPEKIRITAVDGQVLRDV